MSQIYIEKWSETSASGQPLYVYSKRVDPGYVLRVDNCFAYSAARGDGETVQIGVVNGGTKVLVRSRAGADAKEGLSALNGFLVGEGDQVFAHFPDETGTATLELHVIGELFRLEEWRERLKG